MVTFISGNSVLSRMACLSAIMQQRREQYGRWRWSREPAHWIITSSSTGMRPSEACAAQSSSMLRQLHLGDDAVVAVAEVVEVLARAPARSRWP